MATEAIATAPVGDAAQPAKSGKRGVILLALAGLVAGAPTGLFVTGPLLAKRSASAPAKLKGENALANASVTHSVENLVLNPAGSNGTRFLMVTATFELKDSGTENQMKEHDAEVRDHILSLLAKKTVVELTDIGQREQIKKDVLESVGSLFAKGAVKKVFFAQFVIQ
jgi:flagellar basal body-associated protein FliL